MNAYGGVTVPLYDSLSAVTVGFIVDRCHLTTVFAGRNEAHQIVALKRDHADATASLVNLVQFEDPTDEERASATAVGLSLRSFAEVLAAGDDHPVEVTPPTPESIATLCFTSGTTGTPKGAILTHGNIVADVVGSTVTAVVTATKDDVHLSYLPLAHMFERVVHVWLLSDGAAIGFYQGETTALMDDLKALRPTIFCSVPRLWNRIYDKVTRGAEEKGKLAFALFNQGFKAKRYWLERNELAHGFWDAVVFNKVKARVGLDRARLFLTGSAPLAPYVMEFLRIVFGCPVVEGYGQTECTAVTTCTPFGDQTKVGHVGIPLVCNEVKLVSVPDMGYHWNDEYHGQRVGADGSVVPGSGVPCAGRGEVCARGANVFQGYYRDPEKTAEALDRGGWLHTGDIGMWTRAGRLCLIDRKTNMFKLSQGEYVAAEALENVYAKSPFVAQVFVHGNSFQSCLVAVVVPDADYLGAWAKAQGTAGDYAALCASDAVRAEILRDMARVGGEADLRGFEMVKAIHIEPEPWTPENGVLTPTFKLRRGTARERYTAAIDAMYASGISTAAGASGLRPSEKAE